MLNAYNKMWKFMKEEYWHVCVHGIKVQMNDQFHAPAALTLRNRSPTYHLLSRNLSGTQPIWML
jgi:hypothetical protein